MSRSPLLLLALLTACGGGGPIDLDGDGHAPPLDCDDTNPAIHPDATEVCDNGVDDDCDGLAGPCRRVGTVGVDEADVSLVGSTYTTTGMRTRTGDLAEDAAEELIIAQPSMYDGTCGAALWIEVWPYGGTRVNADEAAVVVCSEGVDVDLGEDVALADLDGDGRLDLLATMAALDGTSPSEGSVGVWYGPLPIGTTGHWEASTWLRGGDGAYRFGTGLGVGDFDDDGVPDVAVASMYASTDATNVGAVYVFRGPVDRQETRLRDDAEGALVGTYAAQHFGARLVGVPDMDGDGADELYVGGPSEDPAGDNSGVARVFSRPLGGDDTPDDAVFTVNGTAASGNLGWIAAAGDLDGDGLGDLVIGDGWSGDMAGAALVFFGPMAGVRTADPAEADAAVVGTIPSGHVGTAVGVADVDGDGQDDLLVNSLVIDDALDTRGSLGVFYGPLGPGQRVLGEADLTVTGVEDDGWLGYGEPTAGDVNGDGSPDLVVAAPLADAGSSMSDHGVVYVLLGQGL